MKEFSVPLLCFAALVGCACSLFENAGPPPWFLRSAAMRRLQPKHFPSFPRPLRRQDIPRFMYWKHLLELECVKEICSGSSHKDRSEHRHPLFEAVKRKQIPAFGKDGTVRLDGVHVLHKTKNNQLELQGGHKHGNNRIILWPVESKETRVNVPGGRRAEVTSRKEFQGKPKESVLEEKDKPRFPEHFRSRPTEKAPVDPPPVGGPFPELFRESAQFSRPSTTQHSEIGLQDFRHRDPVQPYEVEEIIEEDYEVDVDDEKSDEGSEHFRPEDERREKPEVKEKSGGFESVIDSSVNAILKGLIAPMKAPPEKKPEGAFSPEGLERDQPSRVEYELPSTPFILRTFTSVPEKTSFFDFPQDTSGIEKTKPVLPPLERHRWRQKPAEAMQKIDVKLQEVDHSSRVNGSRGFDFVPSHDENPEGFPQRPAHEDPVRTPPLLPKSALDLSPMDTFKNLDLLRNLFADHDPNFGSTEEFETTATTEKTTYSIVFAPETPSEAPTMVAEDSKTEKDAATTTHRDPQTAKDPTAEDFTERVFHEFTDRPASFDLLASVTFQADPPKKEFEPPLKNSRKMHFGQETHKTTLTNEILDSEGSEQRRSDILIADDNDGDDDDLSAPNYLEKLRKNHSLLSPDSLNLTANTLIPLVPVLIDDLREGKIPLEDYAILSQALGKYWDPILTLSNFTNLDMLPLLKMKDEKDLQNVLRNFLPEDDLPFTTGTTEKELVEDEYSYDYMDEYKELYTDILGQEIGDKKRRFRPKRDAEDDLKTLEATREYFESLEEERRGEGDASDYMFEDIIYDEVSDGEDSVFELMEVSDVVVGKET